MHRCTTDPSTGESYIQKLYRIPVEHLTLEELEDYEQLEQRRLKKKRKLEGPSNCSA